MSHAENGRAPAYNQHGQASERYLVTLGTPVSTRRGAIWAQPVALNRSLMMTWDEIRSLV
jgi:hypothetical protein